MENTYKELCWRSYFCFYFPPDSQCSESATPYRKAIAEERGCLVLRLIKMVPEIISVSSGHSHPVFISQCLIPYFSSLNSGHTELQFKNACYPCTMAQEIMNTDTSNHSVSSIFLKNINTKAEIRLH